VVDLDQGWRTERLDLEPLTAGHAAELAPVLDDTALHEFIGGAPLPAAALARRYARLAARRSPEGHQLWGNWVMRVRDSGKSVGTEILRTFRECDFAGSVGAYRAVAEISSGMETFVPTADAAPTHGVADSASTVPSARLVTYMPAGTPGEELDWLVDAIASVHPWEHPVIELDRVSLWMPPAG
jgi:hypothetical protein